MPPRPLVREPFPKVKSDPPPPLSPAPSSLGDTPPPDAERRMRSTPPSGSLMLSHLVDGLTEDPREQLIKDQQLTIKLYQQRVTELSRNSKPSPAPLPPRSRAVVAGKFGLNLGKYGTLVVGVLGLADVVVGLWFPEYLGPLGMVKKALGMP